MRSLREDVEAMERAMDVVLLRVTRGGGTGDDDRAQVARVAHTARRLLERLEAMSGPTAPAPGASSTQLLQRECERLERRVQRRAAVEQHVRTQIVQLCTRLEDLQRASRAALPM
jgi:hypothetical protein